MKKYFFVALLLSSICLADSNSTKLGEIPRSADLDKEILSLLLKSNQGWEKTTSLIAGPNGSFVAKSKRYSINSGIGESLGDFERYKFTLSKGNITSQLGSGPLSWVQVSPDEQYIFYEPLKVINTKDWHEIDLEKSIEVNSYFKLLLYSAKMKKVIVAKFDCASDCPKTDKFIILEVSLKK